MTWIDFFGGCWSLSQLHVGEGRTPLDESPARSGPYVSILGLGTLFKGTSAVIWRYPDNVLVPLCNEILAFQLILYLNGWNDKWQQIHNQRELTSQTNSRGHQMHFMLVSKDQHFVYLLYDCLHDEHASHKQGEVSTRGKIFWPLFQMV